jgi:hypothetical protein
MPRMSRTIRSFVCCCGLAAITVGGSSGCTHLIETRAITAFSKNLQQANLEGLKASTSDEFRQRALRTAVALEDLKILRLPDGKTTIVEVEDINSDKKRVTVQVGESKKEIFYELAKDSTGRWVVDDIYLKQKKKGVEAYKSVTEQMDLLLSVREFLNAWGNGDREQVLRVTSPAFRSSLEALPPSFLASMTRTVTSGRPAGAQFKPHAQLDEKVAVVRLPRLSGECVVSLELKGEHWQVSDVAIDSKDDDQVSSMYKLAKAVNNCTSFLAAYGRGDKASLANWSSKDFYEGSLSIGDLSQAKLPDALLSEHELQVKLRGNRADFILKNDAELVQIDMHRVSETAPNVTPQFVVSDVTIYEVATKQEKRLSALFTAQEMLEIFVKSLSLRDLDALKHCSTRDLSSRVWSKLNGGTVTAMPLEPFDSDEFEFVTASFQGALTRIEVRQGGRPLTYLLREESGRFYVDDVQWQITGIPSSLKSTIEVLIPVQDFAAAIALGREPQEQTAALEQLQANSSSDFNRMVWTQCRFVPNSGMSADTFLHAPLKGIAMGENEVTVQLGDNRFGAKVTLRREFDRYTVDDVLLVAGPEEAQRLALKHSLRTQLARGEAQAPSATVPASATRSAGPRTASSAIDESDPFASDLLR